MFGSPNNVWSPNISCLGRALYNNVVINQDNSKSHVIFSTITKNLQSANCGLFFMLFFFFIFLSFPCFLYERTSTVLFCEIISL